MTDEQSLEHLRGVVQELITDVKSILLRLDRFEYTLSLAIMQARRNSEALGVNTLEVDDYLRTRDTDPPGPPEHELPTNPHASEKPDPTDR